MVINWPEAAMWREFQEAQRLHRQACDLEALGKHERAAQLRARADELLDDRTPEVPILEEPTPKQLVIVGLIMLAIFLSVIGLSLLLIGVKHR
jgi:hypothetical protein